MSDKSFLQIKAAIYEMGLLFNQQPSDERINAYANALRNYQANQIIYAFKKVISSGSAFFPSLAEILIHLRPQEAKSIDLGNEVANEIIQKCIEKGRYRTNEIIPALGEDAAAVVTKYRYLITQILDSEQDQLSSIRAQIRDLVKGASEIEKIKKHSEELKAVGINNPNVIPINKQSMKKVSFDEILPESPA
jgi:hypothetical protein